MAELFCQEIQTKFMQTADCIPICRGSLSSILDLQGRLLDLRGSNITSFESSLRINKEKK